MKIKAIQLWIGIYFLFLCAYSVWSFALTDPNLVLTGWPTYWNFQQMLWHLLYPDKHMLVVLYTVVLGGLLVSYLRIIKLLAASSAEYALSRRAALLWIGIVCLPLVISYNALSHDVFNYLFNGKMMVLYGADPYTSTALDFPTDLWTRFMHNTHTFAPYGIVWNWICAAIYSMGGGKFTFTWGLLKVFQVLGVIALYDGLQYTAQALLKRTLQTHELAVLFLNPLFLIETVGNAHNDIWMVIPAVWALGYAAQEHVRVSRAVRIFSVVLLCAVSIGIKYATILITPIVAMVLFNEEVIARVETILQRKFAIFKVITFFLRGMFMRYILSLAPFLCSVLLCIPLFTNRSQQFHPWYLIWVLVWLPLVSYTWWKYLIIILSLTSLLRYIPWLLLDGFTSTTLTYQKLITWSGVLIFICIQVYKMIPGKDSNLK